MMSFVLGNYEFVSLIPEREHGSYKLCLIWYRNGSCWCNSGESAHMRLCEIATEEVGLRRCLFWALRQLWFRPFKFYKFFLSFV